MTAEGLLEGGAYLQKERPDVLCFARVLTCWYFVASVWCCLRLDVNATSFLLAARLFGAYAHKVAAGILERRKVEDTWMEALAKASTLVQHIVVLLLS